MAQCAVVWPTSPLGRDRELAELDAGLADVLAGRGGLFLLSGEPGIGKTRLAHEFGRSATLRGVAVHWGRAWEAGGAPSYWPLIQVLRSICRGLDTDALGALIGMHGSEFVELMPELRQRIPTLVQAPMHAETDRFQLFDAVKSFLHGAADRAPQLLVLDDLHAADPSSLLLLQFLVRDLRSVPLLIIGTYRDVEARLASEIGVTLSLVSREACVLPLRRLERREVADFVAAATGATPSLDFVDTLYQRSEGNPLFLREMLQLRGSTVSQPDGIREVVRARLSLLTPAVRRALEAASVLGREFELELLTAVADTSQPGLGALLAAALDAGIIEALEPPTHWRFTHVLLREGLYRDLSLERRAALHGIAGRELDRRGGEQPLAELAHHFLHAMPLVSVGDAAAAALRAAERAVNLLAFEDGCALLARMVKPLEDAAGEERRLFEVLLSLGVARIRAGQVTLGKDTCRRAAELARGLGDGELFAQAVLGAACEFVPQLRDLGLIALIEQALALLPAGDGALRARCIAQLAAERQPEPDTQGPIELARIAVAMARRLNDTDTLRFALSLAGLTMLAFADPAERLSLDQECLRLALAAGDKLHALRAHLLLIADWCELGDLSGAAAHVHEYEALVHLRHSRYRWVSICLRSQIALWEGRFDEAERWYFETEAVWRQDEGRGAEMAAFPLGLCRAAERYDDLPRIEARLRAAFAMQQDLGSCVGEMLIAQLYARVRDRPRVLAQMAVVRSHASFTEITEASWLALLAEPCCLLGDIALAERLYRALLPHARRFFWLGPLGAYYEPPYGRQLGLLAETLGRLDQAIAHFSTAEMSLVQAGMLSHLARLRYELAGALLARAGAGDRERAAELIEQAQTLAEQLGQPALVPLLAARAVEARAISAAPQLGSAGPAGATAESPARFELRREGEYWTVVSGRRTQRLRDSRGLQVLAQLLANPGQEFHVLQLVGSEDQPADRGDSGTVLDAEAVRRYRDRLLDLREELEEAQRFTDAGRADRARAEIDFVTQELARAVGLGGRARRAGSAAERARTAIQKRLRNAIGRIEQELPQLAQHLEQTIRTGTLCGYLPAGRSQRRRG
jgi:tetratricopeptide (TPR) repeat protein